MTKTATIITVGTLTIERWTGFLAPATAIGALTIAAPAATTATAAATSAACASSNWSFGVVDYTRNRFGVGLGDQILVTWALPTVCSGTVASFVLRQTTPDGTTTEVPATACEPALVVTASAVPPWSCALKVAAVPATTLDFQVVATTSDGLLATSRSVRWVRGAAPDADVSLPGAAACGSLKTFDIAKALVQAQACFFVFVRLLIDQGFAILFSSGQLSDSKARTYLKVSVAFSDTQTARRGRATKATWVSIGKKTIKIKKAGKLPVALPLSKKGTALLREGPLKVRVTYALTRGTATRTIVQYATLPRVAS